MVNNIISYTWVFLYVLFFSGKQPECKDCIDTIPFKKIEQAVSAPLDSLAQARRVELDSLTEVHDSIKEVLDSMQHKPFIGKIDSFPWYHGGYHKKFWWYKKDKWGNINYLESIDIDY